jgi:hypothetical protein
VNTRAASLVAIGAGVSGEIAMNIRLTGRTALILAAGLWFGLAGHVAPTLAQDAEPAATEAPPGQPIALKKFTRHQAAKKKVASVSRADKVKAEKARASDSSDDAAPVAGADAGKATLPASIANANAQQLATEPAADPFATTSPQANALQADALLKSVNAESHPATAVVAEPGAQVVSADELNELDRAAAEPRPALTLASATLDAPAAAPAASVETTSADNSTWDKTSLIGKVFIAFGGLLTMASAARMFIA